MTFGTHGLGEIGSRLKLVLLAKSPHKLNPVAFRLDRLFSKPLNRKVVWMGTWVVLMGMALWFSQGLQRPIYHDEGHFLEAVRLFQKLGFSAWADYPEVTPPLFYQVYAWWGMLFGDNLWVYRLLSLFFGGGFLWFYFKLLSKLFSSHFILWIAWVTVAFNPYFLGASVLLYTDAMALFFLGWFLMAWKNGWTWEVLVSGLGGLLTRQYFAFILVAAGISQLVQILKAGPNKDYLIRLGLLGCSILPLAILMWDWEGAAPPSGLEKWDPGTGLQFHPSYLSTYLSFAVFYGLPLILMVTSLKLPRSFYLYFGLGLGWYFLFPVQASAAAQEQMGIETVGLVHKLTHVIIPIGALRHFLLAVSMGIGTGLLVLLLKTGFNHENPFQVFLCLGVLFFLLLMPWSYQVWEKYLLLVLPVLIPLAGMALDSKNPTFNSHGIRAPKADFFQG